MDTAVDLVFTDSSSNSQSDWTGGAPAADYLPGFGLLFDAACRRRYQRRVVYIS